ncbi:MAG: bifunctional oligoribonuclease/PAP phosphatase NrnA [Candidatus Saganbacteria bacterium]|nr:bifunctional oligoribonuclease/PAP phosphatase NrnA [Candidatus Saganbacteria bacterium]
MKEVFRKIKKAVKGANTVIVVSHEDPDGDTIGSMIALSLMLKKLGKKVTMYSPDPIPHIYSFLPHAKEVKSKVGKKSHFDLGIAVDAGDIKRVRIKVKELSSVVINIDHHPDNTMFGDINYVERASSVAEQIYKLCNYFGVRIDREMGECLYAAMITDTGNFQYENTSVETFKIASDLLRAGVAANKVAINIYERRTLSSLKLLAEALKNVGTAKGGKVIFTSITEDAMRKVCALPEDLTGIVDHLRSVIGAEVAILFREEGGRVKVNFRSKEKVNVGSIAKSFGGGGHFRAAGCVIPGKLNGIMKRVIARVLKSI